MFHLEVTTESIKSMVEESQSELIPGPFIQDERTMLGEQSHFQQGHELMDAILNKFIL
jgi:hypothetical protein